MTKSVGRDVAVKGTEPRVHQHGPEVQTDRHTIRMPMRRWRTFGGGSTSLSRSRMCEFVDERIRLRE
jgi:hypothetical protein